MPRNNAQSIIRAEPTDDLKTYQTRVNDALRRLQSSVIEDETEAAAEEEAAPSIRRYGACIVTPTTAKQYVVGRASSPGTVTAVWAHVTGGTSVLVNAQNAGNDLRSADLEVAAATTFTSFGSLQNVDVVVGNMIKVEIVTVTGAVDQCVIQVDVEE